MRPMVARVYATEAGRLLWRELALLSIAAVAGVGLAAVGEVGLAIGMVVLNGGGALLSLKSARRRGSLPIAPRWPRLRATLWISEQRLVEAEQLALVEAGEALLRSIDHCAVDLRPELRASRSLCARVVGRGLELSRLAAGRRAHMEALDVERIDEDLVARRAELVEIQAPARVPSLVEVIEALSTQRALWISHRDALQRIDAELVAAEQALRAGEAHVRHLGSAWQELSASAGIHDDASSRQTRRLLASRVGDLDAALADLSHCFNGGGYDIA